MSGARLPDKQTIETMLPRCRHDLFGAILRNLRVMDEQQVVNRGRWIGLPYGLTGDLIERILYYKGQGMFFYMEEQDRFYFLPFALNGSIDVYGRYTGVTPLPFNGSTQLDDKRQALLLGGLKKIPQYEIQLEDMTYSDYTEKCVILTDYTRQISQTVLPRQQLIDPILELEATFLPYARTALMNSTGVQGMRITNEDEQSNVSAASASIERAAIQGEKWIPIIGGIDFQDLTGGNVAKSEEFLLAMQAVDNIRQGFHGLDNGGIFQKKAHELQTEANMSSGNSTLVLDDIVRNRQDFCDIVNSIWGLGIWYEPSETVHMMDKDMDGVAGEDRTNEHFMQEEAMSDAE